MTREGFEPTHRISIGARRIPVQVVDGACYTRAEWESGTSADWEIDLIGKLTCQGRQVGAIIRPIVRDK
jgi:hypothetical protein